VIGNKGTIIDACDPSPGEPFPSGTVTGEVNHRLTIAEMPPHNHDNAAGSPGINTTAAGTTSSYTHNHGGTTGDGGNRVESESVSGPLVTNANVSGEGTHNHTIANDTHSHTIASNGGNQCHNNMQPTLFYGNMFIYCGIPMKGTFPFTTGVSPVLI
jgi:microcystin-dependent protein